MIKKVLLLFKEIHQKAKYKCCTKWYSEAEGTPPTPKYRNFLILASSYPNSTPSFIQIFT